MSELLSEDRVAALVEAAKRGDDPGVSATEAHRSRKAPRVHEIDFARPTKFTQDQLRRIERTHESFCRAAATRLSAELRLPVELEVINVAQLAWSSALAEVPEPSLLGVLETEPLGTRVALSCELPGMMRVVERLLGGTGTTRPPQREPSEIELALARRVFGTLAQQLSTTWEELADLSFNLVELDTQVASVQLAQSSEPALGLTIEARLDGASWTLSLLVPHRAVEPVLDRLGTGQYGDGQGDAGVDADDAEAVRRGLGAVEIELRAEVAALELPLDRVLALRPGDVLRLGGRAEAGVTLYAGDAATHRCKPGRLGRSRAVEVVDRIGGP